LKRGKVRNLVKIEHAKDAKREIARSPLQYRAPPCWLTGTIP